MEVIKTIVIEDEKEDLDLMLNLLKGFETLNIVATASDIENGIAVISAHKPDLVFLDINLYGRLSFEILEVIQNLSINPKVVFTTAFDNYMNRAFKFAAFDYLLKPLERQELKDTINRYLKNIDSTNFKESLSKFKAVKKKLVFNTTEGFEVIDPVQIMYLGTVKGQSYTEFFMTNGTVVTVTKGIGEIEQLLSFKHFFKIHRSYILNVNYIKKINRIRGNCYLQSATTKYNIPVSREKIKELKEKLSSINISFF